MNPSPPLFHPFFLIYPGIRVFQAHVLPTIRACFSLRTPSSDACFSASFRQYESAVSGLGLAGNPLFPTGGIFTRLSSRDVCLRLPGPPLEAFLCFVPPRLGLRFSAANPRIVPSLPPPHGLIFPYLSSTPLSPPSAGRKRACWRGFLSRPFACFPRFPLQSRPRSAHFPLRRFPRFPYFDAWVWPILHSFGPLSLPRQRHPMFSLRRRLCFYRIRAFALCHPFPLALLFLGLEVLSCPIRSLHASSSCFSL